MRDRVLIDNDVLLKIAAWRLDAALLSATTTPTGAPGMLAVGRFVVRRRLARLGLNDANAAQEAFERLCAAMTMLEPEPRELEIAAALEEEATRDGLELDVGESQLLAILLGRGAALLLTGDKRAIRAMAALRPDGVGARLASFEQLIRLLLARLGDELVRAGICAEPVADTALSICFACHREACPACEIEAGLASYVGDLARSAGPVLIADGALSALAA